MEQLATRNQKEEIYIQYFGWETSWRKTNSKTVEQSLKNVILDCWGENWTELASFGDDSGETLGIFLTI
jgi:hypothetical protein